MMAPFHVFRGSLLVYKFFPEAGVVFLYLYAHAS